MSKLIFRLQKEYFATITDYVKFNYLRKYPDKVVELSSLEVTKVKSTYNDGGYSTVITAIENLDDINGVIIRESDLLAGTTCVTWAIQMTRPFLIFAFNGNNTLNYNYIKDAGVTWNSSLDTWMPFIGNIKVGEPVSVWNVYRECPEFANEHYPNENYDNYVNGGFQQTHPRKIANVPYVYVDNSNNNGYCQIKAYYVNLRKSFHLYSCGLYDYTRQELLLMINTLQPVTTTQTLTLGSTLLAKLTEEDKKLATDKGWTLA